MTLFETRKKNLGIELFIYLKALNQKDLCPFKLVMTCLMPPCFVSRW